MYASAPGDELHFQRFLSANCFGDYITRTGLGVPTRELVTFAILAASAAATPRCGGMRRPTSTSAMTGRR